MARERERAEETESAEREHGYWLVMDIVVAYWRAAGLRGHGDREREREREQERRNLPRENTDAG
jgi:hypothetical protein